MPILDLDTRFRELGRLRLGEDLGDRPTALEHWRLTSAHHDLLEAAAELYGGTVDVWRDGFELTTETSELDVLIPFQDVTAGQWLELWQGSTLARRCNGRDIVNINNAGETVVVGPCQCDPASRDCKPVTHLRVVLPQLPDLGIWRLVTRSVYAAIELPGAVELLLRTHGGELAPASLAIELRRGGKRRPYVLPVLRTHNTLNQLVEAGGSPPAALAAPSPPAGSAPAANPSAAAPSRPAELGNPDIASEAPRSPVDAPTEEAGPPAHTFPKIDLWRRLGRLLADNPVSELTTDNPKALIGTLEELEELMLELGLWSPTTAGVLPLDSSAARLGLDDWRVRGVLLGAELRAFAQRAFMAAGNEFPDHRAGRAVLAELREEATA